jgi:hypothetical protein
MVHLTTSFLKENTMASRTWVSGVGDDANPGSRTAPCKTFAGAISKTLPPGEINVVDPGGFGAVTITKAITIDGAGTFASILASGTNAIVINAGPTDVVTIRNLSLNGGGNGLNGINFLAGAALHIENCVIFGFAQNGVLFSPAASARLFIKDSIIRNNNDPANGGGLLVSPGAAATVNATLDNVRLEMNRFGISATDRANVTVRNSVIADSLTAGVLSTSVSADHSTVCLESCMVIQNNANASTIGISSNGAQSFVEISNVLVTRNAIGLAVSNSGRMISFGNNSNFDNQSSNGAPTQTVLRV